MYKLAVIAALASSLAVSAHADILFTEGNDPSRVDENILFQTDQTGPTVQGITNTSNAFFNFSGAGKDLSSSTSNGQARLTAASGTFTAVTIAPDTAGSTFTGLVLNLNTAQGAGSGTVTFTVDQVGGPTVTSSAFNLGNGQNFFTIYALNGQKITSVSLNSTVDLQDARQFRVGGFEAVPEPASMAALGIGAAALLRRRRR